MATVEMTLPYNESSRRDFLFARRKSGGKPPPRRPQRSSLNQPEPPHGDSKVTRRLVIGASIAGGLSIAGALLLKPWELFTNSDQRSKEEWRKLSPKSKITKLEFKQYPQSPDFNPQYETVKAVSEYYCQVTACHQHPDQLQQSTMFAGRDRIIEEVEFDNDLKLDGEQRKKIKEEVVELFGVKRGLVLISEENLQKEARKVKDDPEIIRQLGGRDAYTVMLKSVLFHAFTHANADKSAFPIRPITIPSANPVEFDMIGEGFVFFGRRRSGERVFVPGANEAIVEYIATYLGQETGLYLGPPVYKRGVRIIERLNNAAGLPANTFIEYNNGRRPKSELLRVWGSLKNRLQPDDHAAAQVFLTIGLLVDSPLDTSPNPFIDKINDLLKP